MAQRTTITETTIYTEQMAKTELSATGSPAANDVVPTAELLAEVVSAVAEAIEAQLGIRETIRSVGGPYESSQLIVYERKLAEAAASALATVVNHPRLRPTPS